MENLRFVVETEPNCYPFDASPYVYNSEAYLRLKKKKFGQLISFYVLASKIAIARIHFFFIQEDGQQVAVSLPESPFGSLEFKKDISTEVLQSFLAFIKTTLAQREIKCIRIKDCIPAYRADINFALHEVFIRSGFTVEESLVNHHVEVDAKNMHPKLRRGKKRRIQLSNDAGFEVRPVASTEVDKVYDLLHYCYKSKGRMLSLSKEGLCTQLKKIPHRYPLFAVYDKQKMIAAAVCVRVSPSILYTFYYAALTEYDFHSPSTFLLHAIYKYCYLHQINVLDLGTSNSTSVADFKASMGGLPSNKLTYQIFL